jgi:hypothetical protein
MGNHVRRELLRLYRFGMLLFALQAIYISVALYLATSFEMQFMAVAGLRQPILLWALLPFFFIFILVPIILIFVTYCKLYAPEKNMRASSNKKFWNILLTFLGLVFGLVIGGFLFAKAYDKIRNSE